MDKNDFLKEIQEIKCSTPVIVLGSGSSVPYGIPGMEQLASELKSYFNKKPYEDTELDDNIKKLIELLDSGIGLEEALLKMKVPDIVEADIVKVVWNVIREADAKVFERYLGGENINLTALFSYIIYGDPQKTINIVSTNYDRIAEYAANQTKAYINIGFTNGLLGKVKNYIMSKPNKPEIDYTGFINILKVHGSLDWYRKDDVIYNIPNSVCIPDGYIPCIVTPGKNKYERALQEPHRQLLSTVDKVFTDAQNYICIGYGFNDNHVQELLLTSAKRKKAKILIVTKDITNSIKEKVIDKDCYDYVAIYSDGKDGTIFKNKTGSITIHDEVFWTVDGLMKI